MRYNFQIIEEKDLWQNALAELPDFAGKIYYSYEYLSAYEKNGDGRAIALMFRQAPGNVAFYPVIIRSIPFQPGYSGFNDIETAYGYGGPYFNSTSHSFIRDFFTEFSHWANEMKVVAEFVRFNPLSVIDNNIYDFYQVSLNRKTIAIPLKKEFSEILCGCTPARRRNYRRAQSEHLTFSISDNLNNFKQLYQKTMSRLNAEQYYFFSDSYFCAIENLRPEQRFFTNVSAANGETVAAGIFLTDSESAHYHLGASAEGCQQMQPATFMMLEAARHANTAGLALLHLGGGLTLSPDDSLFRFKKGFSGHFRDFFIGRRIHQPEIYNSLSNAWQLLTGRKPSILLHYHYGIK